MKLNILCVGDIVGRPGRRILANKLAHLVNELQIDCVIANAENAAGGSGLTPQIYEKLLKYGVNLITLGDHTYRKLEIIPLLETSADIARPANLSAAAAGKDYALYKTQKGPTVAAVALIGRMFMRPADCPYYKIDSLLGRLQREADIIVVDFHAEATSEKVAMGYYLDGKVSCLFGTHTHVTTADERIMPKGTAYITDVGMTGAHDSVLGRKPETVLKFFRTQMPVRFDLADSDARLSAILVTVDSATRQAEHIERICVCEDHPTEPQAVYDADDGKPDFFAGF
jgi:hypothetical protein